MNPEMQSLLDQRFARGKEFITTRGSSLLDELTGTYKEELWDFLEDHSILALGDKLAIDRHMDLEQVITRQVTFLWALGYAVGSAGFETARSAIDNKT